MAWVSAGWSAPVCRRRPTYIVLAVTSSTPAQARYRSVGRAFLLLPARGLGRIVAPDFALGGGLGPDRGGVVRKNHVYRAETVPAHHPHDVCHLRPLRARCEAGLERIEDMLIIAIACWGVSFAMFGRMFSTRGSDAMLRAVLALFRWW